MSKQLICNHAFESGKICVTDNAVNKLNKHEIFTALNRHLSCDWGELGNDDWKDNDEAFKAGGTLRSRYISDNQIKFWIITEWDRTATTVLLLEDY